MTEPRKTTVECPNCGDEHDIADEKQTAKRAHCINADCRVNQFYIAGRGPQ